MSTTALKKLLKRSAPLARLNAALKNRQLERRTREIGEEYRSRVDRVAAAPPDLAALVAARMAAGGTRTLAGKGSPGIFLVGTYYEQENSGFIQALDRAGRLVALKTATGTYGLRPPSGAWDPETREENARQIVGQVTAARASGAVDVLIGTMVAQTVPAEALRQVRAMGIPVLNIAMDDRLTDHWERHASTPLGAIGLAPDVDLVLQTTTEYLPRYLAGGHPAVFWPFGSDPSLFTPSDDKRYDVVFVGNNYGWRAMLIRDLQRAGIRVECFGSGFPNGHIDAARVAAVFAQARIVLGVGTVAHSRRIVTLKLRDFDGPMSGSLYVTTENPDLHALFDVGREMLTYRSPRECLALLRRYLADEPARAAIAAAGRRRAVRDHTWDQRIRQAFQLIGQA